MNPIVPTIADALPAELAHLYDTIEPRRQELAWESFIASYSELVLRVARHLGGSQDAIMDRYAYVLGELRRDDFHRLRAYRPREAGRFDFWLTTVVRRLCLDHYRHQYGRAGLAKSAGGGSSEKRQKRRRLADLLAADVQVSDLPASIDTGPEAALALAERGRALEAALARINPDDRLLLKLEYEEELGAREIAGIMHLPTVFHVYRRRNAILLGLRRALLAAGVREVEP